MNGLNHNALTCSAVPIPPWERPLQTVEAQPYFNVSQASLVLEGIVFDRNNNLLFVDILPGLAVGNGIAIDPAGSQIWATEHAKNRLHRVRLSDATTVAPFGSVVTYQFTGPAPDGARVDSEGNVYVAISGQGRVMVFNRNGLPIGQIVLPDRDKGRNLKSTSLAIRPGHRELFIVANSGTEPSGAMIFRSGAFAPAPFPFSHQ
ncbi:TPA: SMP-30/gluconolactonase/LRE family protein [Klebsiella pneumoniae]